MRRLVLLLLTACHTRASATADGGATAVATSSSMSTSTATPVATATATSITIPQPPPAASTSYPYFRKTTLAPDALTQLVEASPELARVGSEVTLFDPGDGNYLSRSSADHEGVIFTSQPLLWSPSPGRQALVVVARGKAASFVAAWWALPDGGYRLASTFVMLSEIAPLALAYKPGNRELFWTTCWQCPGETGHVSVREDGHLVIVQD